MVRASQHNQLPPQLDKQHVLADLRGELRMDPSDSGVHRIVSEQGDTISDANLERLERLDDAVFGALAGDAQALNDASELWSEAVDVVEPELLKTTIRKYRQKAREAWGESNDDPQRRLTQGFVALEILEILDNEFS